MRLVLRGIAVLLAAGLLLASCSPPVISTQQTTTPIRTTASQSSPTSTTKSPTATPTSPVPTIIVGTLQVEFIDVGQGDAILIRHPAGINMLIDGGDTDTGIVQYLKDHGIKRLDVVVATHPHADHIGGLVQVLKAIPVAKVVTNGQPTTTRTYENFLDAIAAAKAEYVEVKRGDTIRFGELVFNVLNPVSATGDDLNNGSIVLRLVYGKVSFLFAGDAQAEAEASMSVSSVSPVQATILKVGHHGSRTSSSPAFLALVKPAVAIYSAGSGNSYGHPHPETIASLLGVGARIYGTDLNGTVAVTTDGWTYQVQAEKGQPRGPPVVTSTGTPVAPALTSTTSTSPVTHTSTTILAPIPTSPSKSPATLSLDINSVTSPVRPGARATLSAKTAPGASCFITVYYKSGPSAAQGLGTMTADANGNVSWTWTVGARTTPGEWLIVVKASQDGQSVTKQTTFKVGS